MQCAFEVGVISDDTEISPKDTIGITAAESLSLNAAVDLLQLLHRILGSTGSSTGISQSGCPACGAGRRSGHRRQTHRDRGEQVVDGGAVILHQVFTGVGEHGKGTSLMVVPVARPDVMIGCRSTGSSVDLLLAADLAVRIVLPGRGAKEELDGVLPRLRWCPPPPVSKQSLSMEDLEVELTVPADPGYAAGGLVHGSRAVDGRSHQTQHH